eukprot:4116336-Pyramimonas_sp.AAC.1
MVWRPETSSGLQRLPRGPPSASTSTSSFRMRAATLSVFFWASGRLLAAAAGLPFGILVKPFLRTGRGAVF